MKAVIMAGGFGTRIRPLTYSLPKPMLPLVNIPIMEHVLDLLKRHGFTELVVLLFFQPEAIKSHFGDGSSWGVSIKYVLPDADYGTAGAVGFARNLLDETFLVISADLLTDFDLTGLFEFHRRSGALATIGLVSVVNPLQFGVVITEKDGRVARFLEKPGWGEVFSDTVNAGIYVLEPEVFEFIPEGKEFDFSKDLFPLLLEKKLLFGFKHRGYWRDIGDPDSYREAHYDIFNGKIRVRIPGEKLDLVGRDVRVGGNVVIEDGVRFEGVVVIGEGSKVERGAFLKNSVLGKNCVVKEGASLEGAVLWDNVAVGRGAAVREAVICTGSVVDDLAYVGKGAVLAEGCKVGKSACVKDGVKVWPSKIIEDGAVLADNLIWGQKWRRQIFESSRVVGLSNKELTPEFLAKLGVAYGSALREGSAILTGRDSVAASRMLKRAFIGGVLSTGVHVKDLRLVPEAVLRFKLQTFGEVGGVYFRQSPEDPEITEICFYDSRGLDISSSQEKAVERIFAREDFRRVGVYAQGVLEDAVKVQDFYKESYLKSIDTEALKKAGFRVVVDFSQGPTSLVLPEILSELGCSFVSINAVLEKVPVKVDEERALSDLSRVVSSLKVDCGFWISPDGRRLVLIDETGAIVRGWDLLRLVSFMISELKSDGLVLLPVSAPVFVEEFLKEKGFEVKRIPTSKRKMLEEAYSNLPVFGFSQDGELVFPDFQVFYDAMFALGKILEMRAAIGARFSEMLRRSPSGFFVEDKVVCPWEKKGSVMRRLVEHFSDHRLSLIDGVKIFFDEKSYALAVPDEEKPCFHLFAEAGSLVEARDLVSQIKSLIEAWKVER